MPSGPLDFLTSRDRRARRTASCVKRTSGILSMHRGMVGGAFPPSSSVEFDAKREHRKSAFSFAELASEPSGPCSGGNEDLRKLPLTALARDQKALLPEGKLKSLSPTLPMCRDLAQAIAFLLDLAALLNCFFKSVVRGSPLLRAPTQARYASCLRWTASAQERSNQGWERPPMRTIQVQTKH